MDLIVQQLQTKLNNNIAPIKTTKHLKLVRLDLDSPRMKEAMVALGITKDDLNTKKTRDDFDCDDQRVRDLNYEYYQKRLLETINKVLAERKKVRPQNLTSNSDLQYKKRKLKELATFRIARSQDRLDHLSQVNFRNWQNRLDTFETKTVQGLAVDFKQRAAKRNASQRIAQSVKVIKYQRYRYEQAVTKNIALNEAQRNEQIKQWASRSYDVNLAKTKSIKQPRVVQLESSDSDIDEKLQQIQNEKDLKSQKREERLNKVKSERHRANEQASLRNGQVQSQLELDQIWRLQKYLQSSQKEQRQVRLRRKTQGWESDKRKKDNLKLSERVGRNKLIVRAQSEQQFKGIEARILAEDIQLQAFRKASIADTSIKNELQRLKFQQLETVKVRQQRVASLKLDKVIKQMGMQIELKEIQQRSGKKAEVQIQSQAVKLRQHQREVDSEIQRFLVKKGGCGTQRDLQQISQLGLKIPVNPKNMKSGPNGEVIVQKGLEEQWQGKFGGFYLYGGLYGKRVVGKDGIEI